MSLLIFVASLESRVRQFTEFRCVYTPEHYTNPMTWREASAFVRNYGGRVVYDPPDTMTAAVRGGWILMNTVLLGCLAYLVVMR